MRVLTAVWAALLAVAWGSPAALAQSDGREKPTARSLPPAQAQGGSQNPNRQAANRQAPTGQTEAARPAATRLPKNPKRSEARSPTKRPPTKRSRAAHRPPRSRRKKDNRKDAKSAQEKPGTTGSANPQPARRSRPASAKPTWMPHARAARFAVQPDLGRRLPRRWPTASSATSSPRR